MRDSALDQHRTIGFRRRTGRRSAPFSAIALRAGLLQVPDSRWVLDRTSTAHLSDLTHVDSHNRPKPPLRRPPHRALWVGSLSGRPSAAGKRPSSSHGRVHMRVGPRGSPPARREPWRPPNATPMQPWAISLARQAGASALRLTHQPVRSPAPPTVCAGAARAPARLPPSG